jgi:hypothetical protein
MKAYGIAIAEGANISNLVVASGTSFPSSPDNGELFYRSDSSTTVRGLHLYVGGGWERIASADSVTVPTAGSFPASANTGDLFYKNSNDGQEGLYAYNDSTWVAVASGTTPSYTVTGDVTGTLDGGTNALTLATVNSSVGSFGNASSTLTITTNGKGLVTAVSAGSINIDAAQVISGTFANARISVGSVTQHQASLVLAASQTTSGTFDDARISQSSVTQHQAALTIAETQITDGTLLARIAANEVITGSWTFNNPVVGADPSSASHLTTKNYVDNAVLGLTWKTPVKVATTTNITLSGTQTIDGVAVVVSDRVLVKNQTTTADNGVYVVAVGTWTRATDFDQTAPIDEVNSAAVFVKLGTTQADTGWTQTAAVTTVGSDTMTFVQFSAAGAYTAGAGLTLTGNSFDVNTASSARIVVNADNIDLATIGTPVTASFVKPTTDAYGRVTATTPVVTADITSLVDATYVNVTGDAMTGALSISNTGAVAQLVVQTTSNTGFSLIRFNNASSGRALEIIHSVSGSAYGMSAGDAGINTSTVSPFALSVGDALRLKVDPTTGHFVPGADNTQNFGSGVLRWANVTATNFTGSLTGAASLNVLKSGDTMTGALNVSGATGAYSMAASQSSGTSAIIRLGQAGVVNWDLQNVASTGVFSITTGTVTPMTLNSSTGNAVFSAVVSGTSFNATGGGITVADGQAINFLNTSTRIAGNGTASVISIHTSNTERARIDSNGVLLIGFTTAASSANRLEANGGVRAQAYDAFGTPAVYISTGGMNMSYSGGGIGVLRAYSDASGTSGTLTFRNSSAEMARFTAAGDFGIGVTPTAYGSNYVNLAVGSAAGGGIFDSIYAGTRAISLFSTAGEGRLDTFGASRVLNIYVNGSQRMNIDTNGVVGIATSGQLNSSISTSKLNVLGAITAGTASSPNGATILQGYYGTGSLVNIGSEYSTAGLMLGYTVTPSTTASAAFVSSYAAATTRSAMIMADNVRWYQGASSTVAIGSPATMAETMRLDASGNFGIGTTSPVNKLVVSNAGASGLEISPNGGVGSGPFLLAYNRSTTVYMPMTHYGSTFSFYVSTTGAIRAMDIDATGNLLLGKATASDAVAGTTFYPTGEMRMVTAGTGATNHIAFYRNASTTAVGSITSSGTTTAFNTSSDKRLKKDIVDAPSASAKIDALQVRSYGWKSDDEVTEYGFVAQELVEVVPAAVKVGDANEEVSDVWGVDYSKLVPLLVKEIQELRTRIAALEAAKS